MHIGMSANPVEPGDHPSGLIAENGCAHATIVVPADAGPADQYAAEDLQTVLRTITGVVLPIAGDGEPVNGNRILIGDTRFTDSVVTPAERESLGREGYVVRLKGRDLALAGGGPYGNIYAVAELYDRLGARWYLPGDLGACIPKLSTARFDGPDVRRTPSFAMRWVGSDAAWNLRNRTNYIRDARLPPAFVVHPKVYHTQQNLIPHEKYDETHPEFFALIGGQRSREAWCKLCNANPQLPAEIAGNMARRLRENPGTDLVSFSPTDGQFWCGCEACLKLDEPDVPGDQRYSRRQMILYNRVAEELEKEFPDQLILVGAYNVYTWPPKDPQVRAHRNLAVIICHYEDYCLAHPTNDPNCHPNQRYLELVRAWQQHTPHVYLYEYYCKGNWIDLPWPIVHTVAADIPFFKSIGIKGLYTQYSLSHIWSNFLVHYAAARLLWDHTTDVAALLEEFYGKFYGEAAEPMKRYHEALEHQVATNEHHFPGNAPRNATHVFTEALMAELDGYLKEATRLAKDDLVQRRIEKIALSTAYASRLGRYYRLRVRARQLAGEEQRAVLTEALQVVEILRDEVLADRTRYEGVSSGQWLSGRLLMAREIKRLKEALSGESAEQMAFTPIEEVRGPWLFSPDADNVGLKENWFDPDFDDAQWRPIDINKSWGDQGYPDHGGFAWYRTRITRAGDDKNTDLKIQFGSVDEEAWVYWNGKPVAQHSGWREPFVVVIGNGDILLDRPNLLAVRVHHRRSMGGIKGKVLLGE